jgi:hypothetical protein
MPMNTSHTDRAAPATLTILGHTVRHAVGTETTSERIRT